MDESGRRFRKDTIAALVVTGLYALLVVGLYFHTEDSSGILGRYTPGYLAVLLCLTALIPYVFFGSRFLGGTRTLRSSSGRTVALTRWHKLTLVVGAILLVLIPVELVYNLFVVPNSRPDVRSFHPQLMVRPVPGDTELRINRWGFRGEDIEKAKPEGTYRIFLLGGSTVFCDEVEFEKTHARVLERRLKREYPGRTIEVQNAGMHWHTSQESVIKLLAKVQDFAPDLVIAWHGINDLYRTFIRSGWTVGNFEPDYSHFVGPLMEMLQVYRRHGQSKIRLASVRAVAGRLRKKWFSDLRSTEPLGVPFDDWRSLPSFERNMRDLVTILQAKGYDILLASQPYLYREDLTAEERERLFMARFFMNTDGRVPDLASLAAGMELFNATSLRIAAERGVPYLDLAARVPKSLEWFLDDVHYTEAGNELIGTLVSDRVVQLGWIEAPAKIRPGAPRRR